MSVTLQIDIYTISADNADELTGALIELRRADRAEIGRLNEYLVSLRKELDEAKKIVIPQGNVSVNKAERDGAFTARDQAIRELAEVRQAALNRETYWRAKLALAERVWKAHPFKGKRRPHGRKAIR